MAADPACGDSRARLRACSPPRWERLHRRVRGRVRVRRAATRCGRRGDLPRRGAGRDRRSVTFIVFGAAIFGPLLVDLTWEAALYAVLSLTVVRMLPVALSLIGTHARAPTAAFLGWFGPRGLATIVLSVYAHGVSARPLTDRYARWYRAHPADRLPPMESVPAEHVRWRRPTAVPGVAADRGPPAD